MIVIDDPFAGTARTADDERIDRADDLAGRGGEPVRLSGSPVVARFHGFDLDDRPLVAQLDACPGEILVARTTVPLTRAMIGRDVVLLFERSLARSPIVMGVLEETRTGAVPPASIEPVLQIDGERRVIEAEREIVLRCGDASITLTRAGKVIIQGRYVLSRSTGYNKIKGAAIDIN